MRKLSEYEDHATECRRMATIRRDPVHRKQLEDMAEAWAMLARERKKKLLREANGQQFRLANTTND